MNNNRKPIIVVGSINMDLVTRTPRIPLAGQTLIGSDFTTTPGGKGANQAVAVARLGYPGGVGVIDESAFVKRGDKSAGVARQYRGRLGKG